MQLIETSDTISFDPDPVDGPLNQGALVFTKGNLSRYGKWARYFSCQLINDSSIKITRATDKKGTTIEYANKTFNITAQLEKAGQFSYCTRGSTSNRSCNFFQQNSGGSFQIWVFMQFSFQTDSIVRENIMVHPGDASVIKLFTRWKRHLYWIVTNADSTETLHYADLSLLNPTEQLAAQLSMNVTAGQTDIHAGDNRLYLANGTDIVVYNHGNLTTPFDTWSAPFTADAYDDYPVQILETDDLDVYVRKNGVQIYRIINGDVALLSDTLDVDTTNLRINAYGPIYVEASDFNQVTGDLDEFKDKWYLNNDTLNLSTSLGGVVGEILTDCGIDANDINVEEINSTQCRGFTIEGQTQIESLQELMVLYDFSLTIEDGKVAAKKINEGDSATTIDYYKLGMGVNNPAQTILTITEAVADTDYPKQVTVKFSDADDNYIASAKILRSQDSDSLEEKVLDLSNHSLSDSVATDTAHNVFRQWYEEKGFINLTASIYYLEELIPGTLISINDGSETYELKITQTVLKDVLIDVIAVRNYL